MKKIPLLASLGAKLFYLTAVLVLVTVSVNSWQNARMFQKDLERSSEDTTLQQASSAAYTTATILENWESQISLVMHSLQGTTESARLDLMTKFVSGSGELAALHVIKAGATPVSLAFALTPHQDDPRFGEVAVAAMGPLLKAASAKVVPRSVQGLTSRSLIFNLRPTTKLPLLAMAIPFNYGNGERIWAVLVLWQDRLSGVLPSSALVSSLLVTAEGEVLSSPRPVDQATWVEGTIKALLGLAASTQASSSFARFDDDDAQDWFGAYDQVAKHHLYVLVRRDAKALHEATTNLIKRTVLWAWIFVLFAILASVLGASWLTKHVRILTEATRRIAGGDFTTRIKSSSRDEIGVLSRAVTEMGTQIQSLLTAQIAKVRLEGELATAKMVQQSFFPRQLQGSASVRLAADYHQASECGGDWWGYFPLANGKVLICIADATGHGAPAALVTAMAYTTAAALSRDINSIHGRVSPAALLTELNAVIWSALRGQVGMTFFAAIIDQARGEMSFANAGHNFPVLMPGDAGKKITTIRQPGVPLGFEPEATFSNQTMPVTVGDKILFYTDGLIECQSAKGQMWGKRPLMQILEAERGKGPGALVTEIVTAAFGHFGEHPLDDDITLVVAEIRAA